MSNSNQTKPKEVGTKYDQDKPKFSLIPQRALEFVARVLTFGAKKYGTRNWVNTEDLSARYTDAALRHINAYLRGEKLDPETNLPHLSHAVASLMFVIEHESLLPGEVRGSVAAQKITDFYLPRI
jgi:hypothetical protein